MITTIILIVMGIALIVAGIAIDYLAGKIGVLEGGVEYLQREIIKKAEADVSRSERTELGRKIVQNYNVSKDAIKQIQDRIDDVKHFVESRLK
jgi:hypothetical protein